MLLTAVVIAVATALSMPPQMANAAPPETRVKNRWPVVAPERQSSGAEPARQAFATDKTREATKPHNPGRWEVPNGTAEISLDDPALEQAGVQRSNANAGAKANGLPVTVKAKNPSPRAAQPKAAESVAPKGPKSAQPKRKQSPQPTAGESADPQTAPSAQPQESAQPGTQDRPSGPAPDADQSSKKVQVRVLPWEPTAAAGVGMLVEVTAAEGIDQDLEVAVDYTGAVPAFGGDWASRAKLVEVPACLATTPDQPQCQTRQDPAEVSVQNDSTASMTLQAAAAPRTMMLAVAADSGGDKGSFGASSLSPAGQWSGGDSTGNFTWSQELEAPEVAGELDPEPNLVYSQHAVDGKTSSTNNQPSWVGEGWDLSQGFIERAYRGCADDLAGSNTTAKTGDLCWGGDNAVMSFGSHSGELVQDGTSNTWRLRDDDGTRVEKLYGAPGSGDDNGEYWRVKTSDGFTYLFGRSQVHSASPATQSTWTVPVVGNQPGEPCYTTSYANSWCQQAWRWNLDQVIDPQGNTMVLYYGAETNKYGRNNGAATTSYTRGGYLSRIEYGLRAGAENAPAPAVVHFDVAERCLPNASEPCTTLTAANASRWPDVPFDQICETATCAQVSPTFFTRKRLAVVRNVAAGQEVDRWTLKHSFPATNDGSSPALWLDSITHAGPGGANPEPPVEFSGTAMESRVDGVEDTLGNVAGPFLKYRITGIKNGMGGETVVTYSPKDCSPASLPAPETNGRRCFPVAWAPPGHQPRTHWFHTYVTTQVTETDRSGVSPKSSTKHYQYQGQPAWAWNDHPTIKDEYRNWDRFVGYGKVTTITGDPNSPTALKSETVYHRGLDGDRATRGGGTKTATVATSDGATAVDHLALRGNPRETLTYNGPNGPVIGAESFEFTLPAPRATNSRGWKAQPVHQTVHASKAAVADGWRRGEIRTSYDAEGRAVQIEDRGDLAVAGDEQCTRKTYAVDNGSGVQDAESSEQVRATSCAAWPAVPTTDQVIEDVRTFYDGLPFGQVGAGNATRNEEAIGTVTNGQITYAATVTGYDQLGREVSETDALGRTTTTAYTPAGAGLLTRETVTSPDPDGPGPLAAHVTTTDYDPRHGTPVKEVEPGGETTEAAIDQFGRITAVWKPGRDRATQSASETYEYTTRAAGPNAVTTKTLLPNGTSYRTSVEIIDGLGRSVQSQTETLGQSVDNNGIVTNTPGRILNDIVVDERGLEVGKRGPTFAAGAPSTTYVTVPDGSVPSATTVEYDGAGRATKSTLLSRGVPKHSATASYQGLETRITPPNGAAPTTQISDTQGRSVAVRTHTGPSFSTAYDEVRYEYNARDEMVSMIDAAGNRWRYTYDLAGNRIQTDDPDAGRSTATFDAEGNQLTHTNARGQTLATTYDALDRKTSLRDTNATGALRAEWVYDTVKVDQPTESSRWIAGQKITSRTTAFDAAGQVLKAETVVPQIPNWIEAPLAKTYPVENTYNADGSLATTLLRGTGNISYERIQYGYDEIGRPKTLSGNGAYVSNTVYSADGKVLQLATGNTVGQATWSTYRHDDATGALTQSRFDREIVPNADAVVDYTRNDAQQLTKITTTFPQAASPADNQCFTFDHQQRITRAWTPGNGDCAAAPSTASLGGPAPYWLDWSFDKAGNRLSETSRTSAGDTLSTWDHPAQGDGVARPHAPLTQKVTKPGQATQTKNLSYDADGNTTARSASAGILLGTSANDQQLTWDPEGKLATATAQGQSVAFAYDNDGDELIRRDGTSTRLDLGHTQLTLNRSSNLVTAERSYEHAGQTVALRTGPNSGDVRTLWSDLNNTATWQVNNATSDLQTRRTHIYGGDRGPAPGGWAGTKGFVQGTNDPLLGIVHLGARDYDPSSGRFLSPDPVIDPENPRQWNAYDYGGANPVMNPDPTGEFWPIIVAGLRALARPAWRAGAPVVGRLFTRYVEPAAKAGLAAVKANVSTAIQNARNLRNALRPKSVNKVPKGSAGVRRGGAKAAPKSSARAPKSQSRGPATKGAPRSKASNAGRSKSATKPSARRAKGGSITSKAGSRAVKGSIKRSQSASATRKSTSARSAKTGASKQSSGRYLNDTWHKATFENRTRSVQYHVNKHGNGRTAVQYTQDAMKFYAQNRSLGQSVTLRDGTAGVKISTKQALPGGGVRRVGGLWTKSGRLVTFWD
ncbi:RHS repeat-associated core domain-containing protein [Mariniluteicoccus endophyticus]